MRCREGDAMKILNGGTNLMLYTCTGYEPQPKTPEEIERDRIRYENWERQRNAEWQSASWGKPSRPHWNVQGVAGFLNSGGPLVNVNVESLPARLDLPRQTRRVERCLGNDPSYAQFLQSRAARVNTNENLVGSIRH